MLGVGMGSSNGAPFAVLFADLGTVVVPPTGRCASDGIGSSMFRSVPVGGGSILLLLREFGVVLLGLLANALDVRENRHCEDSWGLRLGKGLVIGEWAVEMPR